MVKVVDESLLDEITEMLQAMVKKDEHYISFNQIDHFEDSDLRTCVSMIVRIAEDEMFFDANKEDSNLEKLNDKMTFLISAIDSLKPQISRRLKMIAQARYDKTFEEAGDTYSWISALKSWQEVVSELTDDFYGAKLKLPEKKTRPSSWRSRYIARYAAKYYKAELKDWPINENGNPKKKYVLAVDKICKVLNFEFAAATYACREVMNLIKEGTDLEPPII